MRVSIFAVLGLPLLLTGCSLTPTATPSAAKGLTIRGNVHGGQQPIKQARIYLLAAGTSGYGSASTSLLTSGTDGSDSIGNYVLSDTNGSFSVGGDYACTPNTQVYLYALGGDPGSGINSAAGLLAALGNCPSSGNFASAVPFVSINEVSTIAAAYAFSAFATDATHVGSSGTPAALIGITNAFANTTNLADTATGSALATTPAGNGTVPQAEINSLANILAACVNSTGPGSATCFTLFSNAMSAGSSGTIATDTATAAINIAHNPTANVAALYGIIPSTPPFAATFAQPNDFSVSISFHGGGIAASQHIAIDAQGNIWATNSQYTVTEYNSLGAPLSPSTGFANVMLNNPGAIAIDNSGNIWVTNSGPNPLIELDSTGSLEAGAVLPSNTSLPTSLAIDTTGNLWATSNDGQNSLLKFDHNGNYLTTYLNNITGASGSLAIDPAGNIWLSNPSDINLTISEFAPTGALAPGSPFNNVAYQPVGLAFDSSSSLWAMGSDTFLGGVNAAGFNDSPFPFTIGSSIGYPSSTAVATVLDGSDNLWSVVSATIPPASTASYLAVPVNTSGVPPSFSGYTLNAQQVTDVALDSSGNLWADGYDHLVELVGVAAPVTTPLVTALTSSTLATRP